jgi:hypothetical protein
LSSNSFVWLMISVITVSLLNTDSTSDVPEPCLLVKGGSWNCIHKC